MFPSLKPSCTPPTPDCLALLINKDKTMDAELSSLEKLLQERKDTLAKGVWTDPPLGKVEQGDAMLDEDEDEDDEHDDDHEDDDEDDDDEDDDEDEDVEMELSNTEEQQQQQPETESREESVQQERLDVEA